MPDLHCGSSGTKAVSVQIFGSKSARIIFLRLPLFLLSSFSAVEAGKTPLASNRPKLNDCWRIGLGKGLGKV
jgi:hypothetical protein